MFRGLHAAANAFIITSVKIPQHESSLFKHTLCFIHFISHSETNWKHNLPHSQRRLFYLFIEPKPPVASSCSLPPSVRLYFLSAHQQRFQPLDWDQVQTKTRTSRTRGLHLRSTKCSSANKLVRVRKKGPAWCHSWVPSGPLRVMRRRMKKQDDYRQVSSHLSLQSRPGISPSAALCCF